MPIAARRPARSHRSASGGLGRREGVGPGARRPASDPSPQTLVERGWLMFTSRLIAPTRRSVLTCCTCVLVLATISSPAPAAESAPVTVRVEGLTETRVLPTPVTLGGTPLVKEGNPENSCPAHSAIAALDLATGGNWGGPWNAKFKQYELFTVEGETHLFEPESKANYFWWFWLNENE